MNSPWRKIFTPPLHTVTVSIGVSVEFANAPRGGIVSIYESVTPDDYGTVNIPIEAAELLAKTLIKWSKQWKRQNTAWKRS